MDQSILIGSSVALQAGVADGSLAAFAGHTLAVILS